MKKFNVNLVDFICSFPKDHNRKQVNRNLRCFIYLYIKIQVYIQVICLIEVLKAPLIFPFRLQNKKIITHKHNYIYFITKVPRNT